MDFLYSLNKSFLSNLKGFNKKTDFFEHKINCNLFIYKLLHEDTNFTKLLTSTVNKDNIRFIISQTISKYNTLKLSFNENQKLKKIIRILIQLYIDYINKNIFKFENNYLTDLINAGLIRLFFVQIKFFLLKTKKFPQSLVSQIIENIISLKDDKLIHVFREDVIAGIIKKYNEIKKYTRIRINTLDCIDEEITVKPEVNNHLEFILSTIKSLKEVLITYPSIKQILENIFQSFDDSFKIEIEVRPNLSCKTRQAKKDEILNNKRKRSNKDFQQDSDKFPLLATNKDRSINKPVKNSRMLKSIIDSSIKNQTNKLKQKKSNSIVYSLRSHSKKSRNFKKL